MAARWLVVGCRAYRTRRGHKPLTILRKYIRHGSRWQEKAAARVVWWGGRKRPGQCERDGMRWDGLLNLLSIGSGQALQAARFILYGAIVLLLAWTYIRTSQQG